MLYLIATPIGNLKDLSLRSIETLKSVDFVLCEDTRRSGILLKAHGIDTPMRSYHKFSEKKWEESIIEDLKGGKEIALISDAGTPGVADPGQRLVERCRKEGLPVTGLPGPSAPLLALTLSGLSMERFQFVGFLPKKASEKQQLLISLLFYPGVSIFFESPSRIYETLKEIETLGPDHEIAIVREMTKIHEECLRGKATDLLDQEILGEVTVVIEGNHPIDFSLSPKEHVEKLMKEFDLSKQEAMKLVSSLRGIAKKDVYSCFISGDSIYS